MLREHKLFFSTKESKSTIEFLGLWERINNPNFKGVEFDAFMFEAGSNSFVLSPSKWIESTNAIGIISKVGSGGGTYAHIRYCTGICIMGKCRV